jgi:hypothetical protein
MPLSITEYQYESLIAMALQANPQQARILRTEVDRTNAIQRHGLLVRWQDLGGAVPPRRELGKPWPPKEQHYIEMTRRITRQDVDDVLRAQAINPCIVQVTPDPDGRVGWSELDVYDFEVA